MVSHAGTLGTFRGVCLFDLDGTLTVDRTLDRLQRLRHVPLSDRTAGMQESLDVMRSFRGQPRTAFEAACAAARLHPDAPTVIARLQGLGIRCGIATASYRPAAEAVARRLGIEVVAALSPRTADGHLTGEFEATPWVGACGRPVCKAEALRSFSRSPATDPGQSDGSQGPGATTSSPSLTPTPTRPTSTTSTPGLPRTASTTPRCPASPIASRVPTIAVGDGSNDVCMLRAADLGIAVQPGHPLAAAAADHTASLADVPALARALLANGTEGRRRKVGQPIQRPPLT